MIDQIKHQDKYARKAYSHIQLALAELEMAQDQDQDLKEVQIRLQRVSNELVQAIAHRTRVIIQHSEENNDEVPRGT